MAPSRRSTDQPGDLGRRVATRRRDLGLSREELAARAGMAAGYVEYLETRATHLSTAGLLRLASALDTTPGVLLGDAVERAPGPGRASARPTLERLTSAECQRLVSAGGVGRLVFNTERGPEALPVNFRVLDGDVIFRTAAHTSLAAATGHERVSFEVDDIDEAMTEGWSVLLTGRLRQVHDPGELRDLQQAGIEPWASNDRGLYLRLIPTEISGRRIHASR
jgi:transcriptional regulator with XRE-family HTH domain